MKYNGIKSDGEAGKGVLGQMKGQVFSQITTGERVVEMEVAQLVELLLQQLR